MSIECLMLRGWDGDAHCGAAGSLACSALRRATGSNKLIDDINKTKKNNINRIFGTSGQGWKKSCKLHPQEIPDRRG